jgi:hypothetical protein
MSTVTRFAVKHKDSGKYYAIKELFTENLWEATLVKDKPEIIPEWQELVTITVTYEEQRYKVI